MHVIRRAALAASASLLASGIAFADTGRGIDAELFKPGLDPTGVFSVERARGPKAWDFGLRVNFDFAQSPLKLDSIGETSNTNLTGQGDGKRDAVLDRQLGVNFGVSLGLSDKLTLGLQAPLTISSFGEGYGQAGRYNGMVDPNSESAEPGTGFYSTRADQNTEPSKDVPGDARIGLKYRFLTTKTLSLAGQAVLWVPFGDEDVFAGSASATVEPKLIAELALGKGFLAVNASARLRKGDLAEVRQTSMGGFNANDAMGNPVLFPKLYVGSEAAVGAGVLYPLNPTLSVGGEATFLVPLATDSKACPSAMNCRNGDFTGDVLAGLVYAISPDARISFGAGAGVTPSSARSDQFRVMLGYSWTPTTEGARGVSKSGDRDGDGIPDATDICPDEPEDVDGFQDDDGCPELDNDLDGVLDAQDKCPEVPEDRDGFQDADGCPDTDNDNDGIPDATDRCPLEAEDKDDYQDDDGCADPDNDGDGILDKDDHCPNEPETVNGYQDLDGCPDTINKGGPKLVADRIDLQGERVEFKGTTLTAGAKSTLDEVAKIMINAGGKRFRIEVGVEESGKGAARDKKTDQLLSDQRAQVVENYLVSKGVAAQTLDVSGLGSTRPLDAKNPKDPAKNRRVEFILVTQ